MPISNGRNLAKLLGSSANIRSRYVAPVESGSSVSTLADMDALIAETGMTTGDQAFVQENNKLYLYNGTGWYLVATVENAQPTTISGVESAYSLANDGTATVITAVSEDPEGFPLTWSYAVTTGSLGSTATVSQTDNVFTITPSTDTANAGEFSITFSVTDGSTGVVSAASNFTLAFSILTYASYDNVSFNVSSQDNIIFGLTFNTDGTKMYIGGNQYDNIYQYDLSTAFDLSTASYNNVNFSASAQTNIVTDVNFNSSGSIMYVVGLDFEKVYQYNLSTNFDVSTATYNNVSFTISSQSERPFSVIFNPNGTKMYILQDSPGVIYQYNLSTAFNVSTATYNNVSFSFASQEAIAMGVVFNTDGTKMYMVGNSTDSVYQYTLSTGFDLSTASYDSVSFSVASQDTYPTGIRFNANFTKMYISGNTSDSIYQYSTGL